MVNLYTYIKSFSRSPELEFTFLSKKMTYVPRGVYEMVTLRAFASMRAVRLFLRAWAVKKFVFRGASTFLRKYGMANTKHFCVIFFLAISLLLKGNFVLRQVI